MSESNEQEYMQSGHEALAAGDYNAAQVFFKQAIRVNNANEEAWLSLAKTYPTEPDKALKCYENVLKINPLNAEAQRMIDRLSASPSMPGMGTAPAPAAEPADTGESLRAEAAASAPRERKPLGGPTVSAPKGIEGAPESVNLDYLVDFFQRAFKGSMALLTGQGDGSSEVATSWWNAVLMVVSAGFITGLFIGIGSLGRFGVTFLYLIVAPFLYAFIAVIAVGAASFLSHWYLRTYRDGTASLLDHTIDFVRVWFPGTIVMALLILIATFASTGIVGLRTFITYLSIPSGLGMILSILAIAVTGYAAFLIQRAWARLYPTAGNSLWIAVLIALVTTGVLLLP